MKHTKTLLFLLLIALCLLFCACGEKTEDDLSTTDSYEVKRTIGPSEIFSEDEINAAMDAMIAEFPAYAQDYLNPTLTEIIYHEESSLSMLEEGSSFRANIPNLSGTAMALTTVHSIEETASEPNLIPAADGLYHHWLLTYENGKWIVTEPNHQSTMGIGLKEY